VLARLASVLLEAAASRLEIATMTSVSCCPLWC
jgi:hypothetical protein